MKKEKKGKSACQLCGRTLYDSWTLKRHMSGVHGIGSASSVVKKESLEAATATPMSSSSSSSSKSRTFSSMSIDTVKSSESSDDNTCKNSHAVQCGKCGKTLSNKWNLKNHYLVMHDKVRKPCGDCGKRFANNFNLKKHCKTAHGKAEGEAVDNGAETAQFVPTDGNMSDDGSMSTEPTLTSLPFDLTNIPPETLNMIIQYMALSMALASAPPVTEPTMTVVAAAPPMPKRQRQPKVFRCKRCNFTLSFPDTWAKLKHLKMHRRKEERNRRCGKCDKSFPDIWAKLGHFALEHKEEDTSDMVINNHASPYTNDTIANDVEHQQRQYNIV